MRSRIAEIIVRAQEMAERGGWALSITADDVVAARADVWDDEVLGIHIIMKTGLHVYITKSGNMDAWMEVSASDE